MLVYQRVNHINLAEELSEINRNTPFGVTSHNYKSVHARVCGMSGLKMHPKAHGVSSFFPSMAITWDIPHETASSPVVWTKPFITPWLYHPISITSYIPELYIGIRV